MASAPSTADRFLVVRRISAYTGSDLLLGVFTTAALADDARAAYFARRAADPAGDPWHRQAQRPDGLRADDLVVVCLAGPSQAAEVFVVSDYSECFGQICRRFDSLHAARDTADARIEVLDAVESLLAHYALRQSVRLDTPLSDASVDQPGFGDQFETPELEPWRAER